MAPHFSFEPAHSSSLRRRLLVGVGLSLALGLATAPSHAEHWDAAIPWQSSGLSCASGVECAIRQAETIYGPQPGPWECREGYDTQGRLSQMNCNDHPNPSNPIYTVGGFSWPVCDAGETGGATGCDFRKDKDPNPCNTVGDPVDPKLGVLSESITDFRIGTDHPLALTRTYSSDPFVEGMMDNPAPASRLGRGWRTNFDGFAAFWPDGNEQPGGIVITFPSGKQIQFEINSGRYVPGFYNRATDQRVRKWNAPETLVYAEGLFTATDTDGTQYQFNRQGQLLTILFVDGYRQKLEWTGGRNTRVTDTLGRALTFAYDGNGLMTSVSDQAGVLATYGYAMTSDGTAALAGRVFTSRPPNSFVLTGVTYAGDGTTAASNLTYEYANAKFPDALTGVIDERGNRMSAWTYDDQRRVVTNQTQAGSGTWRFAYDEANLTSTVTNPLGKNTVYHYRTDVAGPSLMTQVEGVASANCAADTRAFAYETSGDTNQTNLVQTTDGEGRQIRYTRDQRGFVTSLTRGYGTPDAVTTTYIWHPTLYLVTQKAEPGLTTDYTYDANGRLSQMAQTDKTSGASAGQVRSWTYTYTDGGLLASVDGPLAGSGDSVRYTYSQSGFLASSTDTNGLTTTVTAWNRFGQPTSITDPNGTITALTYDPRGRLASMTRDPSGAPAITRFAYDAAGNLTSLVSPLGGTTLMTYDAGGRLTRLVTPAGETVTYQRDATGAATAVNMATAAGVTSFAQANVFDELGRLIRTVGSSSVPTSRIGYDRVGHAVSVTDGAGSTTSYGLDALNRVISLTDALPATTTLSRNAQDEITSHQDPRGLTTTYQRNGFGEVVAETSPDRGTITYVRDARGLITKRTDARSIVTTYTYDAGGRMLTKTTPGMSASDVTLVWDDPASGAAKGHLTRLSNAAASIQRTYDSAGRVITERQAISPLSSAFSVQYTYDAADNVSGMTYPSGRTIAFVRDRLGRVTRINSFSADRSTARALVMNVTWMPFDGPASLTFGNGLTQNFARDTDGHITGITLSSSSGTALLNRTLNWTGDRLSAMTDKLNAASSQSYTYTPVGRLASATFGGATLTWSYDGVGNRLNETSAGTPTTYTYPATSNHLASLSQAGKVTRAFTYDASGHVSAQTQSGTTTTFTHDDEGRLTQVAVTGASATPATYAYDPLGRLVRRAAPASKIGPVIYAYDLDGHIIAELDATGATQREYVWLGDLPVAVIDQPNVYAPTFSFVHTDHLTRPVRMSDGTGNFVWSAEYKPFGEPLSITGSRTLDARFPGQWFQLETGLAWNWHRHYDATVGRYVEPDPLGLDAGSSLYAYVDDKPVSLTDALGLTPQGLFTPRTPSLPVFKCFDNGNGNPPDCRRICSELALPTSDFGVAFQRCMLACTSNGNSGFSKWDRLFKSM